MLQSAPNPFLSAGPAFLFPSWEGSGVGSGCRGNRPGPDLFREGSYLVSQTLRTINRGCATLRKANYHG